VVATFSVAATPALAASRAFDPFGQPLTTTGTPPSLGYQGGWIEPGTGQVNMAARWYDPSSGGFTSRDTWQLDPSPRSAEGNRYTYGRGSPTNLIDPTGQRPLPPNCKRVNTPEGPAWDCEDIDRWRARMRRLAAERDRRIREQENRGRGSSNTGSSGGGYSGGSSNYGGGGSGWRPSPPPKPAWDSTKVRVPRPPLSSVHIPDTRPVVDPGARYNGISASRAAVKANARLEQGILNTQLPPSSAAAQDAYLPPELYNNMIPLPQGARDTDPWQDAMRVSMCMTDPELSEALGGTDRGLPPPRVMCNIHLSTLGAVPVMTPFGLSIGLTPGILNASVGPEGGGGSGGGSGSAREPRRFSRSELEWAAEEARKKARAIRDQHPRREARNRQTFAVIAAERPDGTIVDVISVSGRRRLHQRQKELRFLWEVVAPSLPKRSPSHDAEVTGLEYIKKQGWKPLAGGASRPICPWCQNTIFDEGGELVGPRYQSRDWGETEAAFIFPDQGGG
jgi:RHS repeat-associated protein